MNDKITFYTNPQSRGRIVHWMLEEAGAPYEIKLLDWKKGDHKKPDYLAINPMGKIPSIVHRGTVITETAAIVAYLADAFPKAGLAPTLNDPKRGTYLRWMFFAAGCLEPALIDKMLDRQVIKPEANGYGTYVDIINVLEKAITPGPFILGDRFMAADLYVSSQIGFGAMTKALEMRATFQNYLARCTDRPSYSRFMAQSDELTEQLKH